MIDLVQLLIIATVCYFLWKQLFVSSTVSTLINKIPGPPAYPIIGNLGELIESTDKVLPNALRRTKQYGPILRLWLGTIPVVAISSAEYVEVILNNNKEITKSFAYRLTEQWLGKGLLTSTGSRWMKHRKMITPTFHFKIVDSFVPVFERQSTVLVDKLQPMVASGQVFDIYPYITRCALDIICETAMGINFRAQESMTSDYITSIYRVSKLLSERISRVYLHPQWLYNLTAAGQEFARRIRTLHDFTERVIRERKQSSANGNAATGPANHNADDVGIKKRKAFLDLLVSAGSDLTDTDIREEVDTFMFEGHDTTTAGISWTIFLLGRHPEIQEQVAEEVLSLWPEGEPLTIHTLNEMKLLERTIKESLRLYPSVPFISRLLDEDLQFGEYLVPANTTISISKAVLHRDPRVFPEPEKFDPDRFLPENTQKRHPFAYVPFSAGPRNCIGQKFAIFEEKSVLASLLRTFRIESMDKEADVKVVTELIQRPKDGIRVRLTHRAKASPQSA